MRIQSINVGFGEGRGGAESATRVGLASIVAKHTVMAKMAACP